jgi:hypothetical protein
LLRDFLHERPVGDRTTPWPLSNISRALRKLNERNSWGSSGSSPATFAYCKQKPTSRCSTAQPDRSALTRIQQISPRHLVIRTGRSSKGTGHHCVGRFFAFSQEPTIQMSWPRPPPQSIHTRRAPILTIGSHLRSGTYLVR